MSRRTTPRKRPEYHWFLAVVVMLLFAVLNTAAVLPPHAAEELGNFDRRAHDGAVRAQAQTAHRDALSRLRNGVPDARVEFDEVLGKPRWVRSERGGLTGVNGRGRGVPTRVAAEFPVTDPHRAAKRFLREHRALFGHGPEVLASAKVQREFVTPSSGLKTVVWEQRLEDVPIFEGLLVAHTARQDQLVSLSSRFHPSPAQSARTGGRDRAAFLADPGVSAKEALVFAARNLGEEIVPDDVIELGDNVKGLPPPSALRRLKARGLPGEARLRLVWLPMDAQELRLCWEVLVTRRARGELFRLLIDARTGEALLRQGLTAYLAEASYRVWTNDSPAPLSPGWGTPNTNQPAVQPRILVTTSALNTNASPAGWINDGDNETRGNNVDAHLDADGNDAPDLPRPQGSPSRVFDFGVDLTQWPGSHGKASTVQLFYWCNWMHDKLYELGFTEAAGNFQVDNFGRGGLGGDPVQADAQDGSGMNNANFSTPQDGSSPRMQMFLFGGATPSRDGDFDAEVILHEYTHGLSNRRVGGGTGLNALQSRGLGEGWSDFYALALLSSPSDDVQGNYAFGAYVGLLRDGSRENYYFGFRRYPYSIDLTKNPLTFKDIDPAQASAHAGVPRSPGIQFADEVHSQGEVWCVTLWEVRARLIQRYGAEAGNRLMLQLVTDGMNLTPADPSFLEARDAIFQADLLANGGANFHELWLAFAKRGMGLSAQGPPSVTTSGVLESFDLPDGLGVQPTGGLIAVGPQGGPFVPGTIGFTLTNIDTNAITWSVGSTSAWLTLAPVAGALASGAGTEVTATINASAGSLAPGIYLGAVEFSNGWSHATQQRVLTLRVGQRDFFTEIFDEADNDLAFHSVTFSPNGSPDFYAACRRAVTEFPTDPAGGILLDLPDDTFQPVIVAGTNGVGIYGKRTNTFFVGSNGYLTFDQGDTGFTEGTAEHFALPRVSALFDDLYPAGGGKVSWKQLTNRVAVTWEAVPQYGSGDANSFQIELFFDGTVRLSWLALGAADGLAGLSDGGGVPPTFIESDFNRYGSCPEPLLVHLPETASEGSGTLAGQGLVQLPAPLSSNLMVSLASSDHSEATVPAAVLVPAGETNATFDLSFPDDALLDGPQTVWVTARVPGFEDGASSMSVLDNETAVLRVTLPAGAVEGIGSVTGLVQVSQAPDADILVHLISSDPMELQVPPIVRLSAGETSAVLVVSIVDDGRIDGDRMVTVGAEVMGWTSGQANLMVSDNESLTLLIELPSAASEAQGFFAQAGRIRLAGVLPTNLVVTLMSDDSTELLVPATVTVPAGQAYGTFAITVVDDALVDGAQAALVTAAAPGFLPASALVSILDDESPLSPGDPIPPDLASNIALATNLQWRVDGGDPVVNGGFESGDFSGWQQDTTEAGRWEINDGLFIPVSGENTTAPFAGSYSAVIDQAEPGRNVLFQEIRIPAGTGAATLHWADRIRNFTGEYNSNQCFRVEIRDRGDTPLAVVYSTRPGDPPLNDWVMRSADLRPFRGRTVRVAFIEENEFGFFHVDLDAVRFQGLNAGPVTNEVYFGTQPNPGPGEWLGQTTNTSWALPRLAPLTTYYWRIVARDGGATESPVWRFTTRGVDHYTVSAVDPLQFVNRPFAVTVTARDADDTPVTNFTGAVNLAGLSTVSGLQSLFRDGFEEGELAGWRTNFGTYEREVTVETAAVGTHSVSLTGGARVFYDGISHALPDIRPEVVQFRVRASTLAGIGGYFVLTGGTDIFESQLAFFYMNAAEGGMGFFEESSGRHLTPYEAGRWYKVTVQLDWNARTFDYYVDDALVSVAIPMSSAEAESVNRVYLFNYDPMQAWWDEIEFLSNNLPIPIAINPTQTGAFVEGRWTGELTVLEPATNMVLKVSNGAGSFGMGNPFSVTIANALSVTLEEATDPLFLGNQLTYTMSVSNHGPDFATNVTLVDGLRSEELLFISATSSQGGCLYSNDTVLCELGNLPGGAVASVVVVVRPLTGGILSNLVAASSGLLPDGTNYTASVVTTVLAPRIFIDDASIVEGDAGGTNAVLRVRLDQPSDQLVSVLFAAADGSAEGGRDFVGTNGFLIFAPGETNRTIEVPVLGDRENEPDEIFFVYLFSAGNAVVADSQGVVLLRDDDPFPVISITGGRQAEGDIGIRSATFLVTLEPASGRPVSASYTTANGSALAPDDYTAATGTLIFNAGETEKTISIPVRGDLLRESNETFSVSLFNLVNASAGAITALGTILNDDGPARVSLTSFTLETEGCAPTNGAFDPGETVTVRVSLQNTGRGAVTASNVTATLLEGGGVASPGAPQDFGALEVGAAAVTRPFSFVATGSCGALVPAVFQIRDGEVPLGFFTNFFRLGAPGVPLAEFFDGVASPGLPPGWSASVFGDGVPWSSTTIARDTVPQALFSFDSGSPASNRLFSPSMSISTTNARLSFRHSYSMSPCCDQGQLRIAIGDEAFVEIITGGGVWLTNGYAGEGWSGSSGGFITSAVELPAAAAGRVVRLCWQLTTETGVPDSGWFLDSVTVADGYRCCGPAFSPRLLLSIVVNGVTAELTWDSLPGEVYRLEYTTSLDSPIWRAAGTVTAVSTTTRLENDFGADVQRFYRLVRP